MFPDVKFYGNSIKKNVDAFGVFQGHGNKEDGRDRSRERILLKN